VSPKKDSPFVEESIHVTTINSKRKENRNMQSKCITNIEINEVRIVRKSFGVCLDMGQSNKCKALEWLRGEPTGNFVISLDNLRNGVQTLERGTKRGTVKMKKGCTSVQPLEFPGVPNGI
jgi:hypothetical protein